MFNKRILFVALLLVLVTVIVAALIITTITVLNNLGNKYRKFEIQKGEKVFLWPLWYQGICAVVGTAVLIIVVIIASAVAEAIWEW